jgi:ABC-type uncharacterized transport system permease subunit
MPNQIEYRTVVDFFMMVNGERKVARTVSLMNVIPNVVVGQTIAFDHPQMEQCLAGTVTNIQHVVFLVDRPLTYIDVEIK